jgi:putative oxidoreductase
VAHTEEITVVDTQRRHDTVVADWTDRGAAAADLGFLVFRVLFAGLFLYHGIWHFQKGMVWFAGFMKFLNLPAPTFMAYAVTTFEVVAGLCLVVGLATRVWGALGVLMMLGTAFYAKISELNVGLLSPTGGSAAETDFLYLAGFLVLLSIGAGKYSVDQVLAGRSLGS